MRYEVKMKVTVFDDYQVPTLSVNPLTASGLEVRLGRGEEHGGSANGEGKGVTL